MRRLTVVDDIFLRSHRGLGTPIALQGLWRTADRLDPELLRQVHTALREGPLGRRVIRPRIPGARRSWRPTTRAYPLEFADRTIVTADLLIWADRQGADLDPEYGPGWRLAAAGLDDGGSIVSLTCSHVLADGRALVIAVDDALMASRPTEPATRSSTKSAAREQSRHESARNLGLAPSHPHSTDATGHPSTKSTVREQYQRQQGNSAQRPGGGVPRPAAETPESDWVDAWRQWSIVLRGTARALWHGIPERPATAAPRSSHSGTVSTHSSVLQCPAADWESAAAALGGTANSLFITLIAKLLWASGFPAETIDASLPVDTRDEPRVDNDLAMTDITVDRTDTPATIREKSRIAYERRMSSPAGMPEELLQVVPDRWAYTLSKGAGERDILCSNIGTLPDSLRTLGPHRCIGVAARAIHPGLTDLPRTRLSGYLCRIADTYTLAIVSLDPEHIDSPETLRGLVDQTTTALLLPTSLW
jgi:hypothetical protein